MATTNKRKGRQADATMSPATVVGKTGSDWSSIQAKLHALKTGRDDNDFITNSSPRSTTEQLWNEKQQAMLDEAAKQKAQLDEMIQEASAACELESDVLYEAQKKLTSLTAQRDSLQMDCQDAEQEILDLKDEIPKSRERVLELEEEALRLSHHKEKERLNTQFVISFYAKCTGISWDYDKKELLAGIVDIPSRETFHRFSIDPKQMTPFETANMLWVFMEERSSDDEDYDAEDDDDHDE